MTKPQMSNNEINKFIDYLDCCIIDFINIKEFINCIKVLKCDLNIYKKRNMLKEVSNNGRIRSKSKTR